MFLLIIARCVQQFSETYGIFFNWTGNKQIFLRAVELLQDETSDSAAALSMLLLTAGLERALSKIYLLKGETLPSLFKDLLAAVELQDIFGKFQMSVLDMIMGTPSLLNLRNVLWHGFLSPKEIDSRYGYFLLAVTMSFGLHLQTMQLQDTPRRPYLTFDRTEILQPVFPDLFEKEQNCLQYIFRHSALIPHTMRSYWSTSLLKFKEGRFGESLILLVPQLECCLRIIFAAANNCPQRVLTAEPDARYVTLTEIFNEFLYDGTPNLFATVVSESEMELLFDIFLHPEGPRVRDRLSHGEVDFYEIPEHLVKHMLCMGAVFCLKFISEEDEILREDFVRKLMEVVECYKSFYYSSSLMKDKVLVFIQSLKDWDSCPVEIPELLAVREMESSHDSSLLLACRFYNLPLDVSERTSFSDGLNLYKDALNGCVLRTVYRQRIESEMTTLLRQIGFHAVESSNNIIHALQTFYTMWKEKLLRSRQRITYCRLLASVHVLHKGLLLVLVLIIGHVLQLNEIISWTSQKIKITNKIMKLSLKCMENLNVMTKSKINKWNEASLCMKNFMLKMESYMTLIRCEEHPP